MAWRRLTLASPRQYGSPIPARKALVMRGIAASLALAGMVGIATIVIVVSFSSPAPAQAGALAGGMVTATNTGPPSDTLRVEMNISGPGTFGFPYLTPPAIATPADGCPDPGPPHLLSYTYGGTPTFQHTHSIWAFVWPTACVDTGECVLIAPGANGGFITEWEYLVPGPSPSPTPGGSPSGQCDTTPTVTSTPKTR